MSAQPKTAKRPHWYLTVITSCPVCGRCRIERIRQYGKRRIIRTKFVEEYDWCDQ